MTADHVDAPPSPGLLGRATAGVAGGLAGGAVFGILMQLTGTIPVVASLVDRESLLVGWAVHLSIAVFVGITYALIFGLLSVALSISTVLGLFYGLVWWVLGGLTLLPLRLGLGLFVFDRAAWQSLAGHLAYGLVLGIGYAVVGQLLARDPHRSHRRPDPVTTPPPPWPAALPPMPPRVARPVRTAWQPLPPDARTLRQRRHGPR